MLYKILSGVVFIILAGLAGQPPKKRTSECLKCEGGVGQEERRKNGKVVFVCDNCGSKWIDRL